MHRKDRKQDEHFRSPQERDGLAKSIGAKGIKVDFFGGDKQKP